MLLLLLLRCLFANSIAILCSSGSPWRMSNVWPRFGKLSLFMLQQQLPPTTREIQCTFSCTLTPLLLLAAFSPPLCCTAISLEGISKFRKIKLNFTQCVLPVCVCVVVSCPTQRCKFMAPVMFVCGWLNHQRQPQPRRQRQQRTLAAASAKAVFNEIFSFAARQAQRSELRAEQAAES